MLEQLRKKLHYCDKCGRSDIAVTPPADSPRDLLTEPLVPTDRAIAQAFETDICRVIVQNWKRAKKEGAKGQVEDFGYSLLKQALQAAYDADENIAALVQRVRAAEAENARLNRVVESWIEKYGELVGASRPGEPV